MIANQGVFDHECTTVFWVLSRGEVEDQTKGKSFIFSQTEQCLIRLFLSLRVKKRECTIPLLALLHFNAGEKRGLLQLVFRFLYTK